MEHEATPLTDLLSDELSEAAAPAVEVTEAEPENTGPARDESGRFAKKGEEESASPAPVEEPPFEHAAVKGERTRRQQAEQERDTFRAELEALKNTVQSLQAPKEQPAPPPSIWEDEQGWQQHFGSQVAQQASFNAHLNMSEMLARRDHSDFDAMKASFLQMAEQNPAIVQQALGDADPWGKAYQIAKNASTMQELGATNLDDLKAKLREELMAEMQAQAPVRPGLPPTLSNERNVGQRTGPAWSGPAPLDQLLR